MTGSSEEMIPRGYLSMIYAFVAALGIAFYFSWSFVHGTWFDVGVYTITVVMVGFGIIGYLLYSID